MFTYLILIEILLLILIKVLRLIYLMILSLILIIIIIYQFSLIKMIFLTQIIKL
jgi:hypothetical protein